MRSNMTSHTRPNSIHRSKRRHSRTSTLPDKSTAHRVMRKPPLRDSWRGLTPHAEPRRRSPSYSVVTRLTSAFLSMTWSRREQSSHTGCSPRGRSIASCSARTMQTRAFQESAGKSACYQLGSMKASAESKSPLRRKSLAFTLSGLEPKP